MSYALHFRCTVASTADGVVQSPILQMPRGITDVGCLTTYNVTEQFTDTLYEAGARGPRATFYAGDHGVTTPLEKFMRMRHELPFANKDTDTAMCAESRKECVEVDACGPHNGSNAVKNSMIIHMRTPEMLTLLWIIIESLRNAFADVAGHLAQWVEDVIDFDDHKERAEDVCANRATFSNVMCGCFHV